MRNSEKTYGQTEGWTEGLKDGQKDGRTDGQTIFCRTLPAEDGGPTRRCGENSFPGI